MIVDDEFIIRSILYVLSEVLGEILRMFDSSINSKEVYEPCSVNPSLRLHVSVIPNKSLSRRLFKEEYFKMFIMSHLKYREGF